MGESMPGQRSDRRILKKLIRFLYKGRTSPKFPCDLVLKIRKLFIGAPYKIGTLETNKTEHLVVNLGEFHCVTFVENVVAITWFLRSRERSFESFHPLQARPVVGLLLAASLFFRVDS
jgi:hypothetical protein